MSTLSIFVDESGDFGNSSAGYYVIGLVTHEQHEPLESHVENLTRRLREIDLEDHAVHSGAAIRGEAEYRHMPVKTRKAVFESARKLRKDYLKSLEKKRLTGG